MSVRWSILLFLITTLDAAVFKVSIAENDTQKLILFHDQHRGTRNFLDMKELDERQKKPLWNFFESLKEKKTPTLMLLEISYTEREKLATIDKKIYGKKPFRKQLGCLFARGKKQWDAITVDSWDEREAPHRQVSWLLANSIDVPMQAYQKRYHCKAEDTCLTWFDANAADDFFNPKANHSFHAQMRSAVSSALQGNTLSSKEKNLGFWSVKPISVEEYLRSLEKYEQYLNQLTQEHKIPTTVLNSVKDGFHNNIFALKALVKEYQAAQSDDAPTMNNVILHHLFNSKVLSEFDMKMYAPLSEMSVTLGDITLLKKIAENKGKFDLIVVYAGGNHMSKAVEYLHALGFAVRNYPVVSMSEEDPAAFDQFLQEIIE